MNKPLSYSDMTHIIIGCGDVGQRLALHLQQQSKSVLGVVQSDSSLQKLQAMQIPAEQLDLDTFSELSLDITGKPVFYFAPPVSSGAEDSRMVNFLSVLKSHQQIPAKIVYISTTGVYGDCQGRWINEDEALKPLADRAKRRLHAELQLKAFAGESNCQLVILRVAGIYGPGKLPLARLSQQQPVIRPEESPFTNRIHIDDLVNICAIAMQHAKDGSLYNVSDGQPGTMADYFTRIALRANLPVPPQISLEDGKHKLSAGMMSYMRESRRLDNSRLLQDLSIELAYPDLDSGLDSCF